MSKKLRDLNSCVNRITKSLASQGVVVKIKRAFTFELFGYNILFSNSKQEFTGYGTIDETFTRLNNIHHRILADTSGYK